ncbi:SDR family oxidoreductase [Acidisoma silvae]|uniref:SDR family oxidoreductase n=1 Tax=Acidisoma silvae TaxID=2802396 RepID=A0A963YMZ3_9PROT|nr:SDR family oxidoreductase [Acidisoma silvae]MCB8873851.1 SDR family oxidoreductase [Acidisoma silvae]
MTIDPRIPRAALITGGAKRLGRAVTEALAASGFSVAIHYNSSGDEAEQLARALRDEGVRAITLQADLGQEAEVGTLIAQATERLGPVGVLVNNASTFERDEWHDATRESWDRHIEPNLRAPFVLIQDMARALPDDAKGVVINLLDQRVWSLTPHFMSYTLSKAALWTLTQTMALALAPRIRVVGIGPGPAMPSPRQAQADFDRQAASVPLGHGTSPEEVAQTALAVLAMPSFTGQMIALDGAQHLQWAPASATEVLE